MPDLPVLVGWLLVGWFCGTPIPHLPPSPILPPNPIYPPGPPVDPGPHPPSPIDPGPRRWLVLGVLGAVGGVIGGYVFAQLFKVDYGATASLLLTFAGSFVGARLVADVGSLIMPRR